MKLMAPKRLILTIGLYAMLAVVIMILASLIGAESVDPIAAAIALFHPAPDAVSPIDMDIYFYLRLPRILMAFLAGASLGLVGAVFQALLRNPLATPFTLGVASGGSFGAVLAIHLPALAFTWGPFNHVQCLGFGGSLMAMCLIYLLACSGGRIPTMELLLAGVTMSMIFAALIMAVRYFSDPEHLVGMDRWLMGGVDVDGYRSVISVLPLLIPAVVLLMMLGRGLDQISFGEEMAMGRGVNVDRLQKLAFLGGSLATASVVAITGPIGFVGLIIPHIVRRHVGPHHRLLLPCAFFAAGGFLVLCDTLARILIAPTELPVGIITALLGGPFFIYLLIQGRRTGKMWGGEA